MELSNSSVPRPLVNFVYLFTYDTCTYVHMYIVLCTFCLKNIKFKVQQCKQKSQMWITCLNIKIILKKGLYINIYIL